MKINIQNYEAYYLDYLEGNLSEQDALLLNAFFKQHPSLKLIDEDILEAKVITDQQESFIADKSNLKSPDFSQKITDTNVESFLIGALEKQLTDEKQRELTLFLKHHPSFIAFKFMMDQLILTPDLKIIYADKSGLKKRFFLPMYWKYGATAAVATLVLFAINWKTSTETTSVKLTASKTPTTTSSTGTEKLQRIEQEKEHVVTRKEVVSDGNRITPKPSQQIVIPSPYFNYNSLEIVEAKNLIAYNNSEQELNSANTIQTKKTQLLKTTIDKDLITNNEITESEILDEEYIFYAAAMKNPVKPLTNKLSEIIKGEVEFKTSKAANEKPGGFFIKIGNFAITKTLYIREKLNKR